jgi:hypothetical protein
MLIDMEGRTELGAIFVDFDDLCAAMEERYKAAPEEAVTRAVLAVGKVNTFMQERMRITPIIRMAFADWSGSPDVLNELYTMGIKVVHAKAGQSGETADIELSLALQEVVLSRSDIGTVAVVAGDRDYMPVIHRAIDKGRRVVVFSFQETLSGDIRRLLGDGNCLFLDAATGAVLEPGEEPVPEEEVEDDLAEAEDEVPEEPVSPPTTIPVAVNKDKEYWLGLSEDQLKALRSAIRAIRALDPKHAGMKVSKFLVMDLSAALPGLDHLERKKVFNSLVEKGVITVTTKTSMYGEVFAIFQIPRDNPIVKEIVETLGD